ncbi:MAG TPA: hypothetical protein VMO20_01825, partial [Candidatus Acidoferrum sp.]|nr:hypothetical protein [Candidatus Acidoferrum sp.]
MPKIKIVVRLPHDRDYAGWIHVESAAGKRLAGPFPVCGRASDQLARDGKNLRRDPVLPFGDTPLGKYQVQKIIESGGATAYSSEEFGSSGIVLLQPVSGEAALADANGRFGFFIQGGALSRTGRLRPTDGSLRLANRDLRKVVSLLRSCELVDCQCDIADAGTARKGRRVTDVSAASVLAQSKAILAGMLGTASLQPAHRALLRKMLLAGRLSISIPSLLMMHTPAFSQSPASREAQTLLASRHTLSYPILLADASDTSGSSQDYGGHLPDTSDANRDANTASDNSTKAAHDASDEDAKHDSGIGFDTAGSAGGSQTMSLNPQSDSDDASESRNNDNDDNSGKGMNEDSSFL